MSLIFIFKLHQQNDFQGFGSFQNIIISMIESFSCFEVLSDHFGTAHVSIFGLIRYSLFH